MVDHLSSQVLFRSETVAIFDVCCRATEPGCGPTEESSVASLAIPRRGVFVRHVGDDEVVGDAACAMFFNPGDGYRVSHPVPGGDHCVSFHFSTPVLREAVAEHEPRAASQEGARFSHSHGPLRSRGFLAVERLRQAFLGGKADPLRTEEAALRLLDTILTDSYHVRGLRAARPRPATERAHRAWAERARLVINERAAERLVLAQIAKAVHCSPFHLSRVFRRYAGVPLHRYLCELRLRRAAGRILEGERNLTALALDVGFSSQAHLCDAFRRGFGCAPSALRDRSRQQMSKNLEALHCAVS